MFSAVLGEGRAFRLGSFFSVIAILHFHLSVFELFVRVFSTITFFEAVFAIGSFLLVFRY